MSDEDLVLQTTSGIAGAFEELVRRWAPRILALCHARVGRSDEAEDLAQETLLRGLRGLRTLEKPASFGSWLLGIAHRTCLDWLKARKRSMVSLGALERDGNPAEALGAAARVDPAVDPAALERREEITGLLAEVERLPEEHREVLMLFYYEEMKYRDIAALLAISPATVNFRLTRARALLRERMERSRR